MTSFKNQLTKFILLSFVLGLFQFPPALSKADAAKDLTTEPLLQQSDLVYKGAFTLPTGRCGSQDIADRGYTSVGGGGLAYRPAGNGGAGSLLISTIDHLVGEVSIPNPVLDSNTANWNRAVKLHDCIDPTEGKFNDVFLPEFPGAVSGVCGSSPSACLGGMVVVNDKLYGSAWIYYDANGSQRISHFTRPANLPDRGQVNGLYQIGNLANRTGSISGYTAQIPPEYQSLMHGTFLSGGFGVSIFTRTSMGPSAYAYDNALLTGPEGAKIPAQTLLDYPLDHPSLPVHGQGYWNAAAAGGSNGAAVWPTNSGSLLFVYRQGTGPYCYGEETANPKGPLVSTYLGMTGHNASTDSTGTIVTVPNLSATPDGATIWLSDQTGLVPDVGTLGEWNGPSGELLHRFPSTAYVGTSGNLRTPSAYVKLYYSSAPFPPNLTNQRYVIGQPLCFDPFGYGKGTHSYPYQAVAVAYKASDLLSVVNGTKQPYEMQPYATWDLAAGWLNTPYGRSNYNFPGGVAYDPATQRMFVVQRHADEANGGAMVVHVFTVNTVNLTASPISPPAPRATPTPTPAPTPTVTTAPSPVPVPITAPVQQASSLTLTYNGKIRDVVSQSETVAPDGQLDGGFTVTLPGVKTITSLILRGPGIWDTTANGYWLLGAALSPTGSLLNNSSGAVNFSAQSFTVFASDYSSNPFGPGNAFTLTATFADGSTSAGSVTISSATANPLPSLTAPLVAVPSQTPAPVPGSPVTTAPAVVIPQPALLPQATIPSPAPAVSQPQAPVVSNINVTQATGNGVITLSWQTNVATTGFVEYAATAAALNPPVGRSKFQRRMEQVLEKTSASTSLGTAHSLTIPGSQFPSKAQVYYTIKAILPNGSVTSVMPTQSFMTK